MIGRTLSKPLLSFLLALLLAAPALPAQAKRRASLRSPAPGVLCDRYFCADAKQGVSRELTERHLGSPAATRLQSQGDFDPTEFTFANGIFCDVKERLCRTDRYYGEGGQRSGALSRKYTTLLFGRDCVTEHND